MAIGQAFLLSMARVQGRKHSGTSLDDISSFFQQLSVMISSGTPLLHALRLSAEQTASNDLARIGKDMANRVAAGESLHQAAAIYPDVFKNHWVQMIKTGEVSGQLGPLMLQLRENLQKEQATRSKVVSALTYPAILLMIAFSSLFIMLWKVIPTFAEFFADFGTELPAITKAAIGFSNVIKDYGPAILAVMGAAAYGIRGYLRTDDGNRMSRAALMALPFVGDIYIQANMEKFASNLALLLKSGIPLLEALRTVQEIFRDDLIYYSALGSIYSYVARGSSLAGALEYGGMFTPMVLSMTKVGEESGRIADVLEQVGIYYRERVSVMVGRFTEVIEPLIVIGMGAVVGTLLASIYIPMFQLASGPR